MLLYLNAVESFCMLCLLVFPVLVMGNSMKSDVVAHAMSKHLEHHAPGILTIKHMLQCARI